MIEELFKDVDNQKRVFIIGFLLASILPPYYFLFDYAYSIFKVTSTLNLILISASIGMPLALLNFCISNLVDYSPPTGNQRDPLGDLFASSLATVGIYYTPGIATFFHHVSTKEAIIIATSFEIGILILTYIVRDKKPKPQM